MMNFSTHKTRTLLALFLVSVMTSTFALPTETEYSGTLVYSGYYDDGVWGALPIGFSFEFFGTDYTDFYVSSNGLVMFGSGSTQYWNQSIPTAGWANNYIAPFWDDLIIHSTGDIMYQTIGTAPNRKLIIQYSNMSFWSSDILLGTIQVILHEGSNEIQTQYRSIVDLGSDRASGNSATVGLENADGSAGVAVSYNTADYIYSGRAIRYTPDGGGSYTYDEDALYDGVILVDAVPRAGTPTLLSPAYGTTVSDTVTFQWESATGAASYFVTISQNSDLSSPIHTSADLTELSYEYILSPDQDYYWTAYAKNSEGTISWSEIWMFHTSASPPLLAVPQTVYLESGDLRTIGLLFTGGDAGSKTATVTTLPAEGTLYQNDGGVPGAEITTVPTDVSHSGFNVIYSADGGAGNGAGDFDFHFADLTGTSSDETITVNVSPPGIPNYLHASKEIDRVEITFDRNMADPTGMHLQFSVQDNGVGVTSTSCELKSGDPTTIILYVSPNLDTDNAISVAYTKGTVTAESTGELESFDFQLASKLIQVINFSELADRTYGDPDFTLSATASSGLPLTFSSSNSVVVSVSGTTATINNPGEALISATQAGDATYAAVTFERHQLVNKSPATVTLSDLTQEYTGAEIAATVVTNPAGLNVKVTYDGLSDLPIDIGTYTVFAEIEEPFYSGDNTGVLTITDTTDPVPDLASLADLSDECSVTPVAPTATDFYSGLITGTTPTTFPITTQGTTVLTWTYDDGNGNTLTQDQNVIIDDITDPDTPVLATLTDECTVTAVAPTTTDNCGGTITGTTSDPLTYSGEGTYSITWNFADGNGNDIDVIQGIVIDDTTDPVPDNALLSDITAECEVVALTPPTATDNCAGVLAVSHNAILPITVQGTTVVTWTYDDGNGNPVTQEQNVVIDDITNPITPSLADVTGECSATAVVPTTTDACAGTITGTTSDPLTYNTQGSYVITWNFDDGNGNDIDVTQNVIVDDISDPVTPTLADVTGECDATAVVPTTTDACAGTITGTTSDPLTYNTQGSYVITWNFDDGNGNDIDVTQNVIVDDITDPVIPSLADVTGECDASAVVPTTTDVCAGTITGTTSDPLTYTTQGIHVITWNFDDGNGNDIDVTQNVIVNDITDPVIPSLADVTGECDASAVVPTTTDACAGTITGTTSDPLTYTTQGSHVITWNFDDGNGNDIDVTQNVIVDDITNPVTPSLAILSGECDLTAVAPTTSDACAGTITGTTSDPLTYSTQGSHVINWNFNDGNGNDIDVSQSVIIEDITGPVPDLASLPDLEDNCEVTIITTPTATDACTGGILGTTSDPLTYNTQGTHVITWTFEDGNGNSSTQTQNVYVIDVISPLTPILPDVTGECSATATVPTTTDACTGVITGRTTDPLSYNIAGTHVISWTFDDGNGNSITVPQNVIVTDILDPVTPTLADLTDECSLTAVAPTTTDACAGTITGTTTDPLTYDTQGTHLITWTFDDGNGNSITADQNVIIEDLTDPDIPVLADVSGECNVTVTPPTTTDNCAGTISGTTTDPLSYTSQGSFVITWTFDDGNGNSITVDQNVIVDDVTAPTATSPGDVVICNGVANNIKLSDIADNCSIPGIAFELSGATTGSGFGDASVTLFNPGVTTVTYTLEDGNGNTSQYVFTVTNNEIGDIVVTTAGGILTVETSGSYQWINCADSSVIDGATASTFGQGVSGEYAVIVTQNGCTDTSECYTLDYTGIEDKQFMNYEVYPNPANDFVTIRMESEHTNVVLKVLDVTGKILMIEELDKLTQTDLDISRFKVGMYLINIHSDQLQSVTRIIKE